LYYHLNYKIMTKELLEQFIGQNISANKIAKQLNVSLSTVRHYLKKHNIKTNYISFKDRVKQDITLIKEKHCPFCSQTKPASEFYLRRDGTNFSPYCKPCTGKQTLLRQRKFKTQCVEYKGGKCIKCGYNKYIGALDFHHLDPSQKDFTIAATKLWKLNDLVIKELDKCVLLCSNCHREEHNVIL